MPGKVSGQEKKELWTAFLWIWRRLSIECPERLCGGLCGLWVLMNGLLKLFKLCTMVQLRKSRLRDGESKEFGVKVGVHQGSVLSPLLFTIVLEALSREFKCGLPWELLYADDLDLMAELEDKLLEKFELRRSGMEDKGLRVNMDKSKI